MVQEETSPVSTLRTLSASDAQRLCDFLRETYSAPDLAGEQSPGDLVKRWFQLGELTDSEPAAMLPPPMLDLFLSCGMLARDGETLSPTVMLTVTDECLFASDTAARHESHLPDLVIWPNPTSVLLHQFTIRLQVGATLDLGTGCGIQAVFAARHSAHVTATDLNPRAAEFARFNSWLNGNTNIECLTGDTFEPVRHRAFDLIVANPPFFVTPSSHEMFCENDMELDRYCRRVVREAPAHLGAGGYLQMVCEWVQVRGQSWQERVAEWLEGTGCDAWLFHTYAREASAYARERMRQSAAGDDAAPLQHWMDYYRQHGVEQIHGGMLAMRRRSGRNWIRMEEMPIDPHQALGESVRQAFTCIDLLELGSDEALLGARLKLSPDTLLDRQFRQADGRWQVTGTSLRFTAGIPSTLRLEPSVADFLAGLDGRRTLRESIRDLSQRVSADSAIVQRDCLAVVRMLIGRRFVHL